MATRIRLSRKGKKKRPYYTIVVADSRSPRDGKFIEKIGSYDPLLKETSPERIKFDEERLGHWRGVGAQPTEVIERLMKAKGIE